MDKRLVIRAHSITVDNLFADSHYHLYLKCAYAKAFVDEDERGLSFWGNLYEKMQIARAGQSRRSEFNTLLRSMANEGFSSRYPIPVDQSFQILDGSHRVAAAYAHKLTPIIEVYENPSHDYGRSWFESIGFTGAELAKVDGFSVELKKQFTRTRGLSVGVVWGCAFDYWGEIFEEINNGKLATAFWVKLGGIQEKRAFVEMSYRGDGMSFERIASKGVRLSEMSTKVGIFALRDTTEDQLRALKLSIRDSISPRMKDYFFDSIIHIVDSEDVSIVLLSQYGGAIRYSGGG